MESDLQRHHHNFHDHQHQHHQNQNQNQTNSSLTRYRSAPSSYFASIIDREFCEQIFNRSSSPESERIFSRFMTTGGGGEGTADDASQVRVKETNSQPTQFVPSMNNEAAGFLQQQSNYGSASQNFYRSPSRPPLPNQGFNLSAEGSYTMGTGQILPQMKTGGGGNNSSLVRHSSLPAGSFSRIDIENSYAAMRGIGNFGASKSTNEEGSFSSGSRLKNYSSGPPTSAGIMSPIAEIDDKNLASNPDSGGFGEGRGDNYVTGFPIGSWDDSPVIADDISGLKTLGDDDGKTFASMNMSETQNMDSGNRPPSGLAHHLSLPKTATEMAAIEKFLQLQDSVPCKIRAKRGCATHPRSIAERVRRTRISERMRKLQDLVPNMDKQTNTADMLDLAVEYIKDLQQQAQRLSDTRARCTCSNKHQP